MSIINIINPDYSFWELYPELKVLDEFKYIQKEYKTKSSDVMWFIVMCFDIDSKYINLPIEDRVKILSKDYLKDKDWYSKNKQNIDKAVTIYEKLIDTPARRHLRQWIETLEKRTRFLRDTNYDLDNFDKIDKMAANSANIFKTFETIQKELSKEEGRGATKGGHELSLSDSDEI